MFRKCILIGAFPIIVFMMAWTFVLMAVVILCGAIGIAIREWYDAWDRLYDEVANLYKSEWR